MLLQAGARVPGRGDPEPAGARRRPEVVAAARTRWSPRATSIVSRDLDHSRADRAHRRRARLRRRAVRRRRRHLRAVPLGHRAARPQRRDAAAAGRGRAASRHRQRARRCARRLAPDARRAGRRSAPRARRQRASADAAAARRRRQADAVRRLRPRRADPRRLRAPRRSDRSRRRAARPARSAPARATRSRSRCARRRASSSTQLPEIEVINTRRARLPRRLAHRPRHRRGADPRRARCCSAAAPRSRSASTIPYFGLRMKMFPYCDGAKGASSCAARRRRRTRRSATCRRCFAASTSSPNLHDFLCEAIEVRMERPVPMQVGGESQRPAARSPAGRARRHEPDPRRQTNSSTLRRRRA